MYRNRTGKEGEVGRSGGKSKVRYREEGAVAAVQAGAMDRCYVSDPMYDASRPAVEAGTRGKL